MGIHFLVTMLLGFSISAHAIVGGAEFWSSSMIPENKTPEQIKMASHVVALLNTQASEHTRCTGTLLAPNVVLTAAHCIPNDLKNFWVVTSPWEFVVSERWPVIDVMKDRPVDLPANENFDLALVKFAGPLPAAYTPTSYINSFTASSLRFTVPVLGYGETADEAGDHGVLRLGQIEVFRYSSGLMEFRADQTNGEGICQGDSGGPAFLQIGNEFYVLGVVSATIALTPDGQSVGDNCRGQSTFTSTVYFKDWIADKLKLMLIPTALTP